MSSDDFPPQRAATISVVLRVPRDFCSLFLHHLFPRTSRASPITRLFSDCIHLAVAEREKDEPDKNLYSRLLGWRCGEWQKVARLTPTHLLSLFKEREKERELRFSRLLSPNPCRSTKWNGQDGIMSATSQGPAKVERWAPEWASEPPALSRDADLSTASLASRCQLLLFSTSASWLIWARIKRYLSHSRVLCIVIGGLAPRFGVSIFVGSKIKARIGDGDDWRYQLD